MIFVTGVTGQVGSECAKILGAAAIAPTESELDLTDKTAVEAFFAVHPGIEGVIHCAAYTAVDKAEDEPEKCRAVNVTATAILAATAAKAGMKMLYVSSDYVFDGTKTTPYEVDDTPNPLSVYGKTKLDGEIAVKAATNRFFIVRTQWVYGNGNNFVKTMLRLMKERDTIRVVADQYGCPTYAGDLAELLCEMIVTDKYGIYNASGAGQCSWYEFACEIRRLSSFGCEVLPVTTAEYPTKAKRPQFSVLSKKSLEANGFKPLENWEISLANFL
jgi:dTDP-4-dehydrorhamnose reductase